MTDIGQYKMKERKKHEKNTFALIMAALLMLVLLTGCDSSDYKKAQQLYDAGSYSEAASIFEALGDYEDSAAKATESKYQHAEKLYTDGNYAEAIAVYEAIADYEDSAEKIASANKEIMYATYADVFEALKDNVWFYEASSVNAVNVISFIEEKASIKQIYYDGNGPHTTTPNECDYIVDADNIIVTLADESEMKIAYALDGEEITIGDGEYFTPEQIDEGLQGYWGIKKDNNEYIYYFNNGNVKFESAAKANPLLGYAAGSYFYYGPHEGTYTIDADGMQADARNSWQFGFSIKNGKVVMNRCGDVLSVYSGFKGEDGYSF